MNPGPGGPVADTRLPKSLRTRVADERRVEADRPATCSTCHGAGGWQQPDGLIVECPRECMTGGAA